MRRRSDTLSLQRSPAVLATSRLVRVFATLSLWAAASACGGGAGRQGQGGGVSGESDTVATSQDATDHDADASASSAWPPILLAAPAQASHGPFTTSQTCASCHSNASGASAMRDAQGVGVAPSDLWQATMMANAARDPLFRAVLAVEMAATPSIADAIQDKCLTCHSPMMTYTAHQAGQGARLSALYADDDPARAALDGVSCTVCHQITPEALGTPDSFSGGFTVNTQRLIYGPHAQPLARPMQDRSGYTPAFGDHIQSAALCASCHTLFTDAHAADGTPTGDRLPEQTPYLEWRNSTFNTETPTPLATASATLP